MNCRSRLSPSTFGQSDGDLPQNKLILCQSASLTSTHSHFQHHGWNHHRL